MWTTSPPSARMRHPTRWSRSSTALEIIRLAVMLYVRFALSLRNVEYLLNERGIEMSHEAVRWRRFGSMLTAEVRKRALRE